MCGVFFFIIPAENLSQHLYAVQQMKKRCGIFISDIISQKLMTCIMKRAFRVCYFTYVMKLFNDITNLYLRSDIVLCMDLC